MMQKYKYAAKKRINERDKRIAVLSAALFLCSIALIAIVIIMQQHNSESKTERELDMSPAVVFGSQMLSKGASNEMLDELYLEKKLETMTLEEKVGQLLLLRSGDKNAEEFCRLISKVNAGGVVIFAKDIAKMDAEGVRRYLSALQNAGGNDLLVCVDEEGGTVVRVSSNKKLRSQKFKSPQNVFASGGYEALRSDAVEKSNLLIDLGFNVNFAPVADVVTDKDGFLYKRAFGKGAKETAEYVSCVVKTMDECGIGSSLKHFPGYGNSSGDTHEGLVYVDTSLDEIKNSYLVPFCSGIEAGADSVMVTHSVMTAIDSKTPASLSKKVISILRDDMGFDGVIITDGMDMGAVIDYGDKVGEDVCVLAIIAGCDLICTPQDPEASYSALLDAVRSDKISEEQLDESVYRILKWKLELGMA